MKNPRRCLLLILSTLLFTACGVSFAPTPTPVTPTIGPAPKITYLPSSTPSPTPTPRPTPTARPSPTATHTPVPVSPTKRIRTVPDLPFTQFRDAYNVSGSPVDPVLGWSFIPDGGMDTSMAVVNGHAYFGTSSGQFYAVDVSSGLEVWTYQAGSPIRSAPASDGRSVYFASTDGRVYALDGSTGKVAWTYEIQAEVQAPVALTRGTLYVGDGSGSLHAIDASNGHQKWSYKSGSPILTRPAVTRQTVIANNTHGLLFALSLSNGKLIWHRENIASSPTSSPTVASNRVYSGSAGGELSAVDASTGKALWHQSVGTGSTSSPAVVGDTVTLTSNSDGRQRLVSLKANSGEMRWATTLGSWTNSSPAVVDSNIYVGSGDGMLYSVSSRDGKLNWSYSATSEVDSSPVVVSGRVYFGTLDGTAYAVGRPEVNTGPVPGVPLPSLTTDPTGDVNGEAGYVDVTTGGTTFGSYLGSDGLRLQLTTSSPLPLPPVEDAGYVWSIDYTLDNVPDYYVRLQRSADGERYEAYLQRVEKTGLVTVNDHLPVTIEGATVMVFVPLMPALSDTGTEPTINWYAYTFVSNDQRVDLFTNSGHPFELLPSG